MCDFYKAKKYFMSEKIRANVLLIFFYYVGSFFFFLAEPRSMWDLSSPTWDGTGAPCIGSTES